MRLIIKGKSSKGLDKSKNEKIEDLKS